MAGPLPGQTQCLILGNGPSLVGRPWANIPRQEVYVIGVNQSWREVPEANAHVFVDASQLAMADGHAYYQRHADQRTLYHLGAAGSNGVKMDRHDAVRFGRAPFSPRQRGADAPPPERNGGVALKAAGCGGSAAYVALQVAAALGFVWYWLVGLDMGHDNRKFAGAESGKGDGSSKHWLKPDEHGHYRSNAQHHDKLWAQVPQDVRACTRVIAPSATTKLDIEPWPWENA